MITCPKCGGKRVWGGVLVNGGRYWQEKDLSRVYKPGLRVSDYVNCLDCSHKWPTGGRLK